MLFFFLYILFIIKGSVKTLEQKSPWSLKEALGYIKKEYDVCLIDTRPVFDVLTEPLIISISSYLVR